jgi:hypothetical protein
VARLDRVLADLARNPESRPDAAELPAAAPVVRLDERRRRAGRLLLAAAAVVVGGVAVAPLVSGGSGESAGSDRSSLEDTDQGMAAPERNDEGQDNGFGVESDGRDDPLLPGAVSDTRRSISKLPAQPVRPDRFATDARQLRRSAVASRQDATDLPDRELSSYGGGCSPGVWGGGRYLRVAFDREAGWLVYRPPRGETQVVDLFLCGEDTAERSATLPIR